MSTCCVSLTKGFLIVFFFLGSIVFALGLWILIDKNSFASYLGLSRMQVWAYSMALSGVLTGLVTLLGCLGALWDLPTSRATPRWRP
ncbi:leukocyte antigen CD37-like [Vombatus ursinus]|uniref:leukocyte antigen CD37-like n=1 Tax=Vombatus ursinus TaxID=29139 RepID=UPI000FFD60C4|nr:leukocyte antigen CD37-like [Vombatus ursinus]